MGVLGQDGELARGARLTLLALVTVMVRAMLPAPAEAQRPQAVERVVVMLPDDVGLARVLDDFEIRPTYRYSEVGNGFAAEVPVGVRRALEQIPGAIVSPDRPVEKFGRVSDLAPERKKKRRKKRRRRAPAPTVEQILPTGVDRIDAERAVVGISPIDADVAILDTGIAPHPDLNVVGGTACTGQGTTDRDGHGTHVAGTVGARDNSIGVVGVAPGARLYAVKVLGDDGGGSYSSLICGLDWVAARAGIIDVVNMSLGGPGPESTCLTDALHRAVCNVVAAGVTVVVAAGNDADDAANYVPANFDEAITVSAFTDFDGRPGGVGAPTCRSDRDDSFANYSNYGPDVDIAAPGSCIRSTWPGGYNTISGTSMATPHVAGAAARYSATNPAATPVDVRLYLTGPTGSRPQRSPEGLVVDDDPDAVPEPVLYLGVAEPVT